MKLDFQVLPTPCYVVDEDLLRRNLEILASVQEQAGCKILLALKAFSMVAALPVVAEYLSGSTASSLFEARLGREKMGKEVHIYSPAYREEEFGEILRLCDHVSFNSFAQWKRFAGQVRRCGRNVSCGIRVNPEYSEQKTAIYDPCAPGSRLGTTLSHFEENALDGIEGLHFHTLCEQGADALERTAAEFERRFGRFLPRMKWLNMGGGHHITRPGYDIARLVRVVRRFRDRYGLTVYLEPGEAVALNAGFLVTRVLDIVENGMQVAILDASAACHMPDVLEMPYRPEIVGAGKPGEFAHTYRLGGGTCLAGDVVGDYSFPEPLRPGDRLVFCDMAHYTMVKTNTFNGVNLPSIALFSEKEGIRVVRQFGYSDFVSRL